MNLFTGNLQFSIPYWEWFKEIQAFYKFSTYYLGNSSETSATEENRNCQMK